MRALAVLLLSVAALGACSLGDCSFETARTTTTGGLLVADGRGVGDTLTVAFVTDAAPGLEVAVDAGVGEAPSPTPDGAVEVLYDAVALTGSGDRVPRPLTATVRGDTAFVYAVGALDPSVFSLACSPPPYGITVDVRAILVPAGTVAARVATVSVDDLPAATAAALRQHEADRALARPIHT
ncbi:hypothetical protein [Rubrivirga sp.]|uniref:hypothetical protein n=1 Tax=Rubrivirga sp. TaxID=1885344 RepID=UPI003B51D225